MHFRRLPDLIPPRADLGHKAFAMLFSTREPDHEEATGTSGGRLLRSVRCTYEPIAGKRKNGQLALRLGSNDGPE